ncbi:MAG: VPDSG-CTERM sorting domain-containing protein [Verrucomicrobia bacterium]|nr:VPDSG-CTERM sorting domain-containing protein [Verrucomicrobiota bacterium]
MKTILKIAIVSAALVAFLPVRAATVTIYSGFGTTPSTALPFTDPVGSYTASPSFVTLSNSFGLTDFAATVTGSFSVSATGYYVIFVVGGRPFWEDIGGWNTIGPGPWADGWQIGSRANEWYLTAGVHHFEIDILSVQGLPYEPTLGNGAGFSIRGWGGDPATQNAVVTFLPDAPVGGQVPDSGDTLLMLATVVAGFAAARRRMVS